MSAPVLAVVDIGSNSIKILVATRDTAIPSTGPGFRVLFQENFETRISGGLGRERSQLSEQGMAAGLDTIKKLLALAQPYTPTHCIIVATSAVRDAANRDEFAARVREIAGVPLQIISGGEEALLIARGIQTDPGLGGVEKFCILDLGGGSLECIRFVTGVIEQAVSLQLGAVRLTEKFVIDPKEPFPASAREAVARETQRVFQASGFHFISNGKVVGTGGAFAVTRAILSNRRGFTDKKTWPVEILRADIAALLDEISMMTAAQRAQLPKLTPERADIMPAALTTMLTMIDFAKADRVYHSWNNLRFGLAARFFTQPQNQR